MSDEHQQHISKLAAEVLSGIIAGKMAGSPNFDVGSIRPFHVQAAVNLAVAIVDDVQQRVKPKPNS